MKQLTTPPCLGAFMPGTSSARHLSFLKHDLPVTHVHLHRIPLGELASQ
jgi:hypothetical protein